MIEAALYGAFATHCALFDDECLARDPTAQAAVFANDAVAARDETNDGLPFERIVWQSAPVQEFRGRHAAGVGARDDAHFLFRRLLDVDGADLLSTVPVIDAPLLCALRCVSWRCYRAISHSLPWLACLIQSDAVAIVRRRRLLLHNVFAANQQLRECCEALHRDSEGFSRRHVRMEPCLFASERRLALPASASCLALRSRPGAEVLRAMTVVAPAFVTALYDAIAVGRLGGSRFRDCFGSSGESPSDRSFDRNNCGGIDATPEHFASLAPEHYHFPIGFELPNRHAFDWQFLGLYRVELHDRCTLWIFEMYSIRTHRYIYNVFVAYTDLDSHAQEAASSGWSNLSPNAGSTRPLKNASRRATFTFQCSN